MAKGITVFHKLTFSLYWKNESCSVTSIYFVYVQHIPTENCERQKICINIFLKTLVKDIPLEYIKKSFELIHNMEENYSSAWLNQTSIYWFKINFSWLSLSILAMQLWILNIIIENLIFYINEDWSNTTYFKFANKLS